jgi:predicted RNase H-like HicB family nuclease
MLYPIAIERGTEHSAYGVVVPDLPGCFSAGDTYDEAVAGAREAIELHLEHLLDSGQSVPPPSKLETLVKQRGFKGWIWALVDISPDALDDTIERVNISVPRRVLRAIDQAASRRGETRSRFLADAALERVRAAR